MLDFTVKQTKIFGIIVLIFMNFYLILLHKKGKNKRNNKCNKCDKKFYSICCLL